MQHNIEKREIFLVYLIEAIKVLITVIFRVFFDDDNKMTHFFVDGNTEFKNHNLQKFRQINSFTIL